MGNCNREIRFWGKHPLTDVHAKILPYDSIFFRNLRILKSENCTKNREIRVRGKHPFTDVRV